ncbi:unnamed protein product [Rotaria socialis]|nr:unnamed protein product [Rotaria socialis]CAF3322223.1 unnamed protein product [Rotaria socialis]CAF3500961.1 unnamed protein product [Rotaria socialis]CAF4590495.1 unnamed protein product [Rotaria socialis]CAF4839647.1 unnamed protein product [Rotaria socialis]
MIVSDVLGERLVPFIHDFSQIEAIYIVSDDKFKYGHRWTTNWSKVKGILTKIDRICKSLKQYSKQCSQDSTSISFISTDETVMNKNLNQLGASFIYTQLLKEILLELNYAEQSIREFTDYCCAKQENYSLNLTVIEEFQQNYSLETAIWLYWSASFICEMVNHALRTQEVNTILKIGFFIRDLHQQLDQLHSEQFVI